MLEDFFKMFRYLLPQRESLNSAILWHNDLHSGNIFVDKVDSPQIVGIIDWQAIPLYPMFLTVHRPSLVEYDGPQLEGLVAPSLPEDFQELDPSAQKEAKALFLSQSLWVLYETRIQTEAPDLRYALRYKETLPCQILGLIGSTFDDGEPHVQMLLAETTKDDVWKKLVGVDDRGDPLVPCPLSYSTEALEQQSIQYAKWERDIERKAHVIDEIGAYPGWNGAVAPDEYEEIFRRLQLAKQRFWEREARTAEERELWERAWPFQDDPE